MAVDVEAIHIYRRLVDNLLDRAEEARPDKHIEPPLTEAHLGDSIWLVQGDDEQAVKRLSQQTQFAAVEIAFREKFYSILVRTSSFTPIKTEWLIIIFLQRRRHQSTSLPLSKYGDYLT